MNQELRRKIVGNELRIFLYASAAILLFSAFLLATPAEIYAGMKNIVLSRDVLLTDYFKIAGYGASFFNAVFNSFINCMASSEPLSPKIFGTHSP